MQPKIHDLKVNDDGNTVAWLYRGKKVIMRYEKPVLAEIFYDGNSVILIEPMKYAPDNAAIYHGDGVLLTRIENPLKKQGAICFKDIYLEGDKFKLISTTGALDFGCFLDHDGRILEVREAR